MAKPFDWMQASRGPARAKLDAASRAAMYRAEIEDRAALLHRLDYNKDKARARLRANVAWDFDGGPGPIDAAAIDAIVDRVFGHPPAGKPAARHSHKGGAR